MSAVVSRPFVEQHALNRPVWERLVNDPALEVKRSRKLRLFANRDGSQWRYLTILNNRNQVVAGS
jgi:hypothetical protein